MATVLVIIHGLVAVALLGAIAHQTLAAWVPAGPKPGSFFGRFRAVQSASFANAIVVLYVISALLGAIIYPYFKIDIGPNLERDRSLASHWLFRPQGGFRCYWRSIIARLLGLLATASFDEPPRTRFALTAVLAFIVWWSFLVGHVVNNIMGFGS